MSKITFRNIRPGDRVRVDGSGPHVFLGFSDPHYAHGDGGVRYAGWKDLAAARGYRSAKDLDEDNERQVQRLGYGHGIYAIFRDVNDGFVWSCYRFAGRWVYGSSCDPARLTREEK